MILDKKTKARRERALLRLLGFDTRKMTRGDIHRGADAARRVTQCGCGADTRRPKALADFRGFVERWRHAIGQRWRR
jgi:hypothetical protein